VREIHQRPYEADLLPILSTQPRERREPATRCLNSNSDNDIHFSDEMSENATLQKSGGQNDTKDPLESMGTDSPAADRNRLGSLRRRDHVIDLPPQGQHGDRHL
jgi:hypothetical protein